MENHELLRVSRLEERNRDAVEEDQVIAYLELLAPCAKDIVVSDFLYGLFTSLILVAVLHLAKQDNMLLFVQQPCGIHHPIERLLAALPQ